ncbi:hypothetical protein [Paraburkholderia panacisoli]|uniref:hypothetical protein n=1 Tax=Paraburkholderia panacisoli TaxID=2603818 RepID=UPI00165FB9F2|nr:hypothetical protein [Paraburkholderia panacisoli]
MTPLTYNLALLVGIILIGAGVGLTSIPHALVVVGALIVFLTLFGAFMARAQ